MQSSSEIPPLSEAGGAFRLRRNDVSYTPDYWSNVFLGSEEQLVALNAPALLLQGVQLLTYKFSVHVSSRL